MIVRKLENKALKNSFPEKTNFPKVAIIILNWNGWQDTLECLESVQHLNYINYEVILVDNCSTNDSVKKIKSWCDGNIPVNTKIVKFSPEIKPVKYFEYDRNSAEAGGNIDKEIEEYTPQKKLVIVQTGDNLGFAGGNNVAIRYALKKDFDYVWLLNNDTVIDRDSLIEMIKLAESDENIGMVGSKLVDYYDPQHIQSVGMDTVFPRLRNKIGFITGKEKQSRDQIISPKWMWAASLLIKCKCIQNIGMFDEKYFFSVEDIELCTRAIRNNWKLFCCINSIVWHKGGLKEPQITKQILRTNIAYNPYKYFRIRGYYEIRNELYFFKKYFPQYVLFSLMLDLVLIIKTAIIGDKKLQRIRIILRAIKDALTNNMGKSRFEY